MISSAPRSSFSACGRRVHCCSTLRQPAAQACRIEQHRESLDCCKSPRSMRPATQQTNHAPQFANFQHSTNALNPTAASDSIPIAAHHCGSVQRVVGGMRQRGSQGQSSDSMPPTILNIMTRKPFRFSS